MSFFDTPLTNLLSHALDLTSARQVQVSQNIANIDTPGYHTRDVDFLTELRRVIAMNDNNSDAPMTREVPGLIERPDGNNVSIDRESLASARMDQKKAAKMAVAIESAFQQLGVFDGKHQASNSDATSEHAAVSLARTPIEVPGPLEASHAPVDFAAIRAELEKALAPEIRRKEVALRMQPDGLVVSLREVGFFDSGSAAIRPSAQDAFARVTQVLREHNCAIRIEGHTDTVPIHTARFASNWELSTARATEVVRVLIEKYSFAAERLSAAGYAQYRPVAGNSDSQGRQLNRRVDVVILASLVSAPLIEHPNSQPADRQVLRNAPETGSALEAAAGIPEPTKPSSQ